MNKFIIFIAFLFISVSITAETVYKKTNPDGSVTFTDQQSTESEAVKIRKPTTYKPLNLPALRLPTKKLRPNFNYSITITAPVADSVITDRLDVKVSIQIQPSVKSGYGHKIRYQLSGQAIVSASLSETFKNVSRGTHNLSISIVDRNGEVISPVASRTFHMKRFFKKPKAKVKAK